MKATEMLTKVKDLLGLEVKEEVVTTELSEEAVDTTTEQTENTDVQSTELTEETNSENVEVKLATAELENGTIVEAESFEAGNEIFIVTEDERVALPVGEYTLADGQVLIVEEEGVIASIGEAETEEAPAEEEVEASEEYATKEEMAEVKQAIEGILEIIEDMTKEVEASEEKQELSKVEKVKHNPDAEDKPELNLYSQKRQLGTLDRVMKTISNFK